MKYSDFHRPIILELNDIILLQGGVNLFTVYGRLGYSALTYESSSNEHQWLYNKMIINAFKKVIDGCEITFPENYNMDPNIVRIKIDLMPYQSACLQGVRS